MKSKLLLSVLTMTVLSSQAQNVNIPSANFKACLVGNLAINTNTDTEIQVSEAQAFTGTISCFNQNLGDITGIEEFTSLTGLVCFSAFISSMDLSNNLALTTINCQNNFLTSLDFSANTALTSIACGLNNQLTSLNVANGNNANFTAFAVSNTPNLSCIQIDDADTTGYGWSGVGFAIDAGVNFSDNCPGVTSVNEAATSTMNIYPNPFNNEFVIETIQPTQIRVMNALGEVVLSRTINGRTSIDASSLSSGIYFVQEETSGAVMKLVKN